MKFKNKGTGEIVNGICIDILLDFILFKYYDDKVVFHEDRFNSLAELNKYWEDA